MLKKEFLNQLSHHLRGLPENEIEDILYDYLEFFNGGIQDGRSQEELAESLGNPKSIAKQLKSQYMVKIAKDTPSVQNVLNAIFVTLGLGFFQVMGFSFILGGILIFLDQVSVINLSWKFIWPIFVLFPGIAFEFSYFANPWKNKGNVSLLIPGGILTTIGLLFYHSVCTDFVYLGQLWPIFILAVALGLFQFYYFGFRNSWLLIPIVILTVVGAIFLIRNLFDANIFGIFLSLLFIALGLLIGGYLSKKRSKGGLK